VAARKGIKFRSEIKIHDPRPSANLVITLWTMLPLLFCGIFTIVKVEFIDLAMTASDSETVCKKPKIP
jgi:hypothetical protein